MFFLIFNESRRTTVLPTLMVLSLLAQLLIIDRDCWKRVLPIPMTSAINWLTAITTWKRQMCRHQIYYWPIICMGRSHCGPLSLPVSAFSQSSCVPYSRSCSSWGSRGGGLHHCGWNSAWSYNISKSHSRTRHTCPHGLQKTCRGTREQDRQGRQLVREALTMTETHNTPNATHHHRIWS